MSITQLDTSKELIVSRYSSGIKLLAPSLTHPQPTHSIENILKLPFAVYFGDIDFIQKQCNEICAEACGFDSLEDSIGVKWFKPFIRSSVLETLSNQQAVIANNELKIVEELATRKDQIDVHTLSVRMPWFNANNTIVGIFGFSILLDRNNLANSLSIINSLGLFGPSSNLGSKMIGDYCLSKRETDCLRYTIRGYTAKKTAFILNLSQRTVEEYLNNIKIKIGAGSKAELIDMTIDYFRNEN